MPAPWLFSGSTSQDKTQNDYLQEFQVAPPPCPNRRASRRFTGSPRNPGEHIPLHFRGRGDQETRQRSGSGRAASWLPRPSGERSEGEIGRAIGDNYTADRVDAVAGIIEQLKTKFHPAHTVLVGHSGGAAITGNLWGRHPSAVDGALLVSCDCDVTAWRKHMEQLQPTNPAWTRPIAILSPRDVADGVSFGARRSTRRGG
jgi:pimeloyl-ACP methyl ester carboxylesterase